MNRLFTFGCSFTRYHWPTWADILGKEFDYYENWGQIGGGNQYIFNSLIEAKSRNNFSKDDTIIIMWSNVTREDRYYNNSWVTPGNIFTQLLYPDSFVKKFADDRGYLIRDLATISAAADLLEYWGVKYHFLSMVPINNVDQYTKKLSSAQDVLDLYYSAIEKIKPSIFEIIFNFDWTSRFHVARYILDQNHIGVIDQTFNKNKYKVVRDLHALPAYHLEYLEKILPEYSISNSTKEWVKQIDMETRKSAIEDIDFYSNMTTTRLPSPKKRL